MLKTNVRAISQISRQREYTKMSKMVKEFYIFLYFSMPSRYFNPQFVVCWQIACIFILSFFQQMSFKYFFNNERHTTRVFFKKNNENEMCVLRKGERVNEKLKKIM